MTNLNRHLETNKSSGIFYGWIMLAACFPAIAIAYGCMYSFGVFLIPLRESFGASTAAISAAYSTSMFVYMAFGILAGWAADRYGPKITTITGALLMGLGFLLTSQVNAVWQLYLTYALIGIGMSPAYTPLMATITRWFVRRRGLALGIVSTGVGAGPVVMAPLASHITIAYGWRSAFIVLGCITALAIPLAFLMKRSPEEIGSLPDGDTDYASISPEAAATKTAVKSGGLSLKEAINTRAFWQIATIYCMIGLSLQIVMAHVVAYSQGKGVSPITAATIVSTISGFSAIGRMGMGLASDWMGRKKALAICLCAEGIMILLLIGASTTWMFFVFAVIFGFFYGGHVPQLPALVGETLGLAHMGIVLGATSFFWGVGGAIGPFLAGYIVDVSGTYTWAFVLGGVGLLFATAVAVLLRRP